MVQWQSPTEIAKDGVVFDKFMHTLLGLYLWEFFTSLSFDWQYISGKKNFKWPLVFYFSGRYCLLFALIGITIALNVTEPVNCQALYTYNQLFGNATIGFASINLSLRTMAVWSMSWWVVAPMIAISLGHWSLLLHGKYSMWILLTASWIPGQGCVITTTSNTILAATFIYTMCFDFLVLTLTAIKLGITGIPRRDRSRIVRLIFDDGLIFFLVAFGANAIATSFMLVNLNAVMSIIANVPAAVASTIVSCRVVRRLTNYTTEGAEVFGSTHASTLAFSRSRLINRSMGVSVSEKKREGVHVQMDTLGAAPGEISPSDTVSVHAYGNVGCNVKCGQVESFVQDVEASSGEEYKTPAF